MQIIYISTSGEKYPRFHLQNMKARKMFASCSLTVKMALYKRCSDATHQMYYRRRDKRKECMHNS